MPVNLSVQADVIDIRNDTPQQDDIFLVDTNVWFWQTYSNASVSHPTAPAKISEYSSYLSSALSQGSTLTYLGLILAELAHIIEKTEREIYIQANGFIRPKEYRHNLPAERLNVVSQVRSAWTQVEAIAVPVRLTIDDDTTSAALARFQTQALDGYDLLILEAISKAGSGQVRIITDDMDYAIVPGIQVFTSNSFVIQQANAQNKLLVR
ncbi:MAG: hypothetical protein SFY66_04785 [Oculatellaceae cyanobacterium bins.114]|nr:hypothetical protein [Oculatellaceae cyanobacterium bins.114]